MNKLVSVSGKAAAKRRLPFSHSARAVDAAAAPACKRWLIYAGGTLLVLFMAAFGFLFICGRRRCPLSSISQTSQMLDLQGNVIDTFHAGENRQSVPLKDISPYLVEATLAIEDQRFYDHLGFDMKGMARAAVVNVEHMLAEARGQHADAAACAQSVSDA